MKISIITVFPELHATFLDTSIIKLAKERSNITFNLIKLSDHCKPGQRIDTPTVGHGPGMVLKPEVVSKAIDSCIEQFGLGFTIFFSPHGKQLTQPLLRSLNKKLISTPTDTKENQSLNTPHIILVPARYEGMDARIEEHYADFILSIGDYVLMGGDIPAQVFLEGLLRLVPGVLGNKNSLKSESFESPFLDHPEHGLPTIWNDREIPEVLSSGHHKKITDWREIASTKRTMLSRFDWFRTQLPSDDAINRAKKIIPNHYVALMHTDVVTKEAHVGTTSVTSVDLHDISRSCATYDVANFFAVTPLIDQQSIINEFMGFWKGEKGSRRNPTRTNALSRLKVASNLQEVLDDIETQEGKKPILIATSAKDHTQSETISYHDQGKVWTEQRPVLILLGSGNGLNNAILEKSDYILLPIGGMTDYKHLSVRSAAGIILDRWLGLNPKSKPNLR